MDEPPLAVMCLARWLLNGKAVTATKEWRIQFQRSWSEVSTSGCGDDIATLADLEGHEDIEEGIFNMDVDFPPIK